MGGITKQGPTELVIFKGTMTADRFCAILEKGLLPFLNRSRGIKYRFQQDNDPKHTSQLAAAFLETNGVNWWKTPPESPDLNPIENIWGSMKYFLRTHHKPHNLESLIEGITLFWKSLTPDVCSKYISHLNKKVIPKVIAVDGAASGY